MNASSRCCGPSSRTTSRPRSRSAARRWSSGTICASPRRPCATTWRCWRRRATSASRTPAPGRVPTDRGYRLFVDKLSRIKPLSPAERRAIERFLLGAVDLDDVVHRTVRLLAQLTRQVAVVQYPSLARSSVRHLELVPISTTRLMLVMIADTGRVEQRLVELPGADRRGRRHRAAPADQREAGRPAPRRHAAAGAGAQRGGRPGAAARDDHAVDCPAGDAGRARRGADRAGRHRQPDPGRPAGLPGLAAPDPGGAGGGGHPAQALRRGRPSQPASTRVRIGDENEYRGPARPPRWSAPATARAPPSWEAWACSGRPGWTTPAPSPRCGPWHATSATCWLRA